MAIAYEWITAGGTFTLPAPGVNQTFSMSPINGKALKRVITRGCIIQGSNAGLTADVVEPIVLDWEIYFNTGVVDEAYSVWHKTYQLPMTVTSFFADAVSIYKVWWSGGDADFGFDQEILRGSRLDVEGGGVLVALRAWTPGGTFNYDGAIGCDIDVRALYAYPA